MTPITARTRGVVLLAACALLAGCASAERKAAVKDQLDRAAATYEKARTDPHARTYAPFPLREAEQALAAAADTRNLDAQEHLGYVAEKRAQTALAIGAWRRAEHDQTALGKETAEIIAQNREREARQARAEAEARGQELGRARQDLEALSRKGDTQSAELDRARGDLDRTRADLDRMRTDLDRARGDVDHARGDAESKGRLAEQARAAHEQASRELDELKARPTNAQLVLMPGEVHFATGAATLAPGGTRTLEKLVTVLQKHPGLAVLIEGHTDDTGNDKLNEALSQKRAEAVKQVLVAKGIEADRITTRGYGKQFPVAPNDSPSGRQQNRRVEVVVLDEGAAAPSASR
jgi:outer membrane protein OmpA-like peptidoglycan-associated protein